MFVCTGNICRSPIAERLALAYSGHWDLPVLSASSAGTRAVVGHPMHEQAALVLMGLGGNPRAFEARQLTPKIAVSADLILTMTAAHRDRVLELVPQRLNRTFTLSEASNLVSAHRAETVADLAVRRPRLAPDERGDIHDPIGQSVDVFEAVGVQIAELLLPVLDFCRRHVTV
ncbi:low molecular weight phosphatase family protein [Mycolicibacterium parafortuitum]|uniref:arsenate reductase/protein-tyrosine-phosphatase family protein n=1 Tax=Mycolicibacterium parafortuitum TaxID=39692 RepID=UPI00307E55BD